MSKNKCNVREKHNPSVDNGGIEQVIRPDAELARLSSRTCV